MTVFVDSSFLVALFNSSDEFHDLAKTTARQLENKSCIFTMSELVLCEAINVVFRTKGAKVAQAFYKTITESDIQVISVPTIILQKGLQLLFGQLTKTKLNLFDCIHLAMMESAGLELILTFDRDFTSVKHLP